MKLSSAQIAQYDEQGYLFFPEFHWRFRVASGNGKSRELPSRLNVLQE